MIQRVPDRFSQETRYLLDVVSFAISQYAAVDVLGVHAAIPELLEDLRARVPDHVRLEHEKSRVSPQSGVVHLLTWERNLSEVNAHGAKFVVVAFQNRDSLKSLKYGRADMVRFSTVTHQVTQARMRAYSWGIYSPIHLGWYQLADWADRRRRYDWGFYLRDRGALSPITQSAPKRWANFGVVVGVRP